MACRECPECSRRYPSGIASGVCPWCDEKLAYNATGSPTVTQDEYNDQCYVRGRKVPASLSPEEAIRIERDWDALAVEMGRRGGWFSEADLIGEGFHPSDTVV